MTADRLAKLLQPYTSALADETLQALSNYVDLVMRWNARTNLTAIRDEDALAQRQVGESLFATHFVLPGTSLLDFGSGAGFPGIPLLLADPTLTVTLAESQGKKATFLREAVRTLELSATVWAERVESLPPGQTYDTVILRAVDRTAAMLPLAEARVAAGGTLVRFLGQDESTEHDGWTLQRCANIPLTSGRIAQWRRAD